MRANIKRHRSLQQKAPKKKNFGVFCCRDESLIKVFNGLGEKIISAVCSFLKLLYILFLS